MSPVDAQNTAINSVAGVAAKWVLVQASDWYEEYLAPIISIKIVAGLDEAIITRHHMHAQAFVREVDSVSVMVNTSTRFADGFENRMGAEIGISTDKFHARGPVGIEGLTSLKHVVLCEGEVRA